MVLLRAVPLAVSTLLPCTPLVMKSLRTFRTIERLEISTGWNEESERISAFATGMGPGHHIELLVYPRKPLKMPGPGIAGSTARIQAFVIPFVVPPMSKVLLT
ncbi:hypothetical protein C8R47DRAFT_1063181 [Mycena vitilis]|nr:hypothetical protein C8R47DRAFT_1063181 [Mycena vitilis]